MSMPRWLPLAATFGVGTLTAVQARMNGQLAVALGNGLQAALWSFGSGLVMLTALVLAVSSIRAGVARIPRSIRAGELSWWQAMGGVLGGFFVAVQSAVVPTVGVAVFTVAVVAGQSSNSLLVDRVGLGPAGKQAITGSRVVSAVLAVAAVALAVSNRLGSASLAVGAVLLALVAGMVIAVQSAINGRTARAAGNPMSATFLNFLLGTIALSAALGVAWAFAGNTPSAFPSGPWWMYLGGLIGLAFIGIASWVVPIVGVLLFAVVSIAGQLSGALVLDVVAPTAGTDLEWNLFAGVLLAFVAVAVAARGRGR